LVEDGLVKEIYIEEFSRIGRNTGDVINNLQWMEDKGVNVVVRNIGLQSRPNGKKNPIWKMISSVMSSLYEMELENIKERTMVGRQVYVQKGGILGRPSNSSESTRSFLSKPKNQEIIKYVKRGMKYSEISKLLDCSPKIIKKVKDLSGISNN
jgi:DNA invertase Pin-like site-specific DNA recombinase